MAEFEIDPMHPVQQIIGIFFVGLFVGLFIENWMKWAIWLIGGGAWFYFNFMKRVTPTGAVKG